MQETGWRREQGNEGSIFRLWCRSDNFERKEGRKEDSEGRPLDWSTVSRKILQGHWKYSSQIHLLEQSCILLKRACLSIRALLSHWLEAAFRQYDLTVNTVVDPIKTSERISKLSTASEFYVLLIEELDGEKQMPLFLVGLGLLH